MLLSLAFSETQDILDANVAIQLTESASDVTVSYASLQTPPSYNDPNVLNSYLVNKAASGAGSGNLTSLGQTWSQVPC